MAELNAALFALVSEQRNENIVKLTSKLCSQAYSCLPATVLASCVESVWAGGGARAHTQLSRALWLWCGALGARVWLPLMPRDATRRTDPSRHTFMAKRIMLPFHLNIYPLSEFAALCSILEGMNYHFIFFRTGVEFRHSRRGVECLYNGRILLHAGYSM